jgi:hypothetical protein
MHEHRWAALRDRHAEHDHGEKGEHHNRGAYTQSTHKSPELKEFRRTKQTSITELGYYSGASPVCPDCHIGRVVWILAHQPGGQRLARRPTSRQAHSHPAERRIWRSDFGPPPEAIQTTLVPVQIMRSRTQRPLTPSLRSLLLNAIGISSCEISPFANVKPAGAVY